MSERFRRCRPTVRDLHASLAYSDCKSSLGFGTPNYRNTVPGGAVMAIRPRRPLRPTYRTSTRTPSTSMIRNSYRRADHGLGARPRQPRAAGRRTRDGLPLVNDSFYRDDLFSSRLVDGR
jgi:hypothetical protein